MKILQASTESCRMRQGSKTSRDRRARFFFTVPLVMALAVALALGLAFAVAPRHSIQR
jgi:hypothetical protein